MSEPIKLGAKTTPLTLSSLEKKRAAQATTTQPDKVIAKSLKELTAIRAKMQLGNYSYSFDIKKETQNPIVRALFQACDCAPVYEDNFYTLQDITKLVSLVEKMIAEAEANNLREPSKMELSRVLCQRPPQNRPLVATSKPATPRWRMAVG